MSRLTWEWGPRRKVLIKRLEISNRDRDEWRQAAGKIAAERDRLQSVVNTLGLDEPSMGAVCKKVRLHNQPEAEAFILKVALTTNEDPREYHTYRCEKCPRHPLIGKFWHIGHRLPSWKRALKNLEGEIDADQ